MKKLLLLPLLLLLVSCDKPPAEIVAEIKEKVLVACAFKASQQWLADIVVKADVTIQLVDVVVNKICEGVEAAREKQAQTLMSMPPCPNGEVEINGESYCIEGEDVPVEGEK